MSSSKKKITNLYWSVEVLPGEAHDDERQGSHAVKRPLSKAEVVDQCVNVGWDDVKNSHNALKWRQKFHILGLLCLGVLGQQSFIASNDCKIKTTHLYKVKH